MADDFTKDVNERWTAAEQADHENREDALEALKMVAGEQWEARDREARERPANDQPPRPCLTINTSLQFINQVVGDYEANPASIKVLPREDGDREVAEVRSELIRSIELQSRAERVYRQAFWQAVVCGIGNMRVDLDYAYEDAFERDIFIRGIANPLSVLWDPLSTDPTGRDAGYCFVADRLTRDEYKRRFPDAAMVDMFDASVRSAGWCEGDDTIRVAEFWRLEERPRTIALMQDGSVQDVTDRPEAEWRPLLFVAPDGQPRIRKSPCRYAVMVLTNGQEQLSDSFELKLPRLPIVKVTGEEIWVGDRRVRFGLMQLLRDHQRMKNYLRSVATEKLMYAPRANFTASAAAIKGRTHDWPNTLVYNDGADAPQAVTESNLQSLMTLAEMCQQDMKDVTGIHDASLGLRSNETSGIAIRSRQEQGDIATINYRGSMNASMQEIGEVANTLIPVAYDTPRTIRVIGEDDAVRLLRINDPNFQPSQLVKKNVDLAKGRYDTTISTGPAYLTRRQEAAAGMIEMMRASPNVMDRAGDLVAEAQDWPNAQKFAERLRPPGAVEMEDMSPEQQAQAQQAAQQQAMQEQMTMAAAQAELDEKQASARLKAAQARKADADADKAEAEAKQARAEAMQMNAETALAGAALASTAVEHEGIFNG